MSAQKRLRDVSLAVQSDASLKIKFKRQHDVSEQKTKLVGIEIAASVALAAWERQ
jgi:hypothetical protein